jgi:hypothetical protein
MVFVISDFPIPASAFGAKVARWRPRALIYVSGRHYDVLNVEHPPADLVRRGDADATLLLSHASTYPPRLARIHPAAHPPAGAGTRA